MVCEKWKRDFGQISGPPPEDNSVIRSDEGLALETSAFESLYGGQFTLSTQLIKPNYLVILPPMQHHSFFRNLPPPPAPPVFQSEETETDFCICSRSELQLPQELHNLQQLQLLQKLQELKKYGRIYVFF